MQVLYSCSRGIWVNRAISKGQFAFFFFFGWTICSFSGFKFVIKTIKKNDDINGKLNFIHWRLEPFLVLLQKQKEEKKKKKEFPIFSHSGNFVSKFAAPREMPIISPTSAKSLLLSFLLLCRYLTFRWVAQLFRLPTQLWCNSFMLGKVLL